MAQAAQQRTSGPQLAVHFKICRHDEQLVIELLKSGEVTRKGIKVHDSGEVHALHGFVDSPVFSGVFASSDVYADAGDGPASMQVLLGFDSDTVNSLTSKKCMKTGYKLMQFLFSADPQVLCVLQDLMGHFGELIGKAVQCTFCCKEDNKHKTTGQVVIVLQAIGSDDVTELPQHTEAGLTNDGSNVTRENHSGEGADAIIVTDEVELDSGTVGNNQPEHKSEGMQQDTQPSEQPTGQPSGQSSRRDFIQHQLSSLLCCMDDMVASVKPEENTEVLDRLESECKTLGQEVAQLEQRIEEEVTERNALQAALDKQDNVVRKAKEALQNTKRRHTLVMQERGEEQTRVETEAKRQKLFQEIHDRCKQLQELEALPQRQQGERD